METILRVGAIYFFVMISLRLLRKREFSQLAPFELVTLLLIPELASQAMLREDFSLTNAIIGLSTLFFSTSFMTHMSKRVEGVVEGKPSILVSHRRFVADHMNRARISPDEAYGEMHKYGFLVLDQVRWAILETDGKISFIPPTRGSKAAK